MVFLVYTEFCSVTLIYQLNPFKIMARTLAGTVRKLETKLRMKRAKEAKKRAKEALRKKAASLRKQLYGG